MLADQNQQQQRPQQDASEHGDGTTAPMSIVVIEDSHTTDPVLPVDDTVADNPSTENPPSPIDVEPDTPRSRGRREDEDPADSGPDDASTGAAIDEDRKHASKTASARSSPGAKSGHVQSDDDFADVEPGPGSAVVGEDVDTVPAGGNEGHLAGGADEGSPNPTAALPAAPDERNTVVDGDEASGGQDSPQKQGFSQEQESPRSQRSPQSSSSHATPGNDARHAASVNKFEVDQNGRITAQGLGALTEIMGADENDTSEPKPVAMRKVKLAKILTNVYAKRGEGLEPLRQPTATQLPTHKRLPPEEDTLQLATQGKVAKLPPRAAVGATSESSGGEEEELLGDVVELGDGTSPAQDTPQEDGTDEEDDAPETSTDEPAEPEVLKGELEAAAGGDAEISTIGQAAEIDELVASRPEPRLHTDESAPIASGAGQSGSSGALQTPDLGQTSTPRYQDTMLRVDGVTDGDENDGDRPDRRSRHVVSPTRTLIFGNEGDDANKSTAPEPPAEAPAVGRLANLVTTVTSFLPMASVGTGRTADSTARDVDKADAASLKKRDLEKREAELLEKRKQAAAAKMREIEQKQRRAEAKRKELAEMERNRELERQRKEVERQERLREQEVARKKQKEDEEYRREEKRRRIEEHKRRLAEREAARRRELETKLALGGASQKHLEGAHPASQQSARDLALMPPPKSVPARFVTPQAKRKATEAEFNSYEMTTEKRDDDDDSTDEENHTKNRKKIPMWARQPHLNKALEEQEEALQDPDRIFPRLNATCDLEEVFAEEKKKKRYRSRGSSSNWVKDRLTWKEEMEYKKAVGLM